MEALRGALAAKPAQQDGQTLSELCASLGIGRVKMLQLLRELKGSGKLECYRSTRLAIDGVFRSVPVYRLPNNL